MRRVSTAAADNMAGALTAEINFLLPKVMLATERSITLSDARKSDCPLVFVNPAFEEATGYKSDEVLGRNCRFLQGDATDDAAVEIMHKAVEAGVAATVTLLNYRKDGTEFWNEVSLSPILDETGALTHFVGVQVDVTAKVLAQRELESMYASERSAHSIALESQASLIAILEQLPSGVVMADAATGRLTHFNPAVQRILRLPTDLSDDFNVRAGDQIFDIRTEGGEKISSDQSPMSRAMRGDISIEPEELLIRRADGVDAIVSVRARPIMDEGGAIVSAVALIDDITQRKEWEHRLDEERKRSSLLAHTLQRSLLPPSLPERETGFEFGAAYSPAGEGLYVGGDFYDVFEQSPESWVVVIGDVMGKGAEAAAVTSFARHCLRTAALRTGQPGSLLEILNQALNNDDERHPFLTVALGMLTRTDRGARLNLALGGHPRPFLVRHSTNEVFPIGSAGTLMGVVESVEVNEFEIDLGFGDIIVMFTDGVTEAHVGSSFLGEDGLRNILLDLVPGHTGASNLAARVHDEVMQFSGNALKDDLAVLVTKVV